MFKVLYSTPGGLGATDSKQQAQSNKAVIILENMKQGLVGNLWEVKFELHVVCRGNGMFMFAS